MKQFVQINDIDVKWMESDRSKTEREKRSRNQSGREGRGLLRGAVSKPTEFLSKMFLHNNIKTKKMPGSWIHLTSTRC